MDQGYCVKALKKADQEYADRMGGFVVQKKDGAFVASFNQCAVRVCTHGGSMFTSDLKGQGKTEVEAAENLIGRARHEEYEDGILVGTPEQRKCLKSPLLDEVIDAGFILKRTPH